MRLTETLCSRIECAGSQGQLRGAPRGGLAGAVNLLESVQVAIQSFSGNTPQNGIR